MELQKGSVVRSKAGRDSGLFLVVVEVLDEFVLICDGKQRPIERPKRKNTLHLALTNSRLTSEQMQTNNGLRKALKLFNDNSAKTS
ncbi:MAG: KOW domain-containing RNA-binding protein [Oscillospiraceae bacterium]